MNVLLLSLLLGRDVLLLLFERAAAAAVDSVERAILVIRFFDALSRLNVLLLLMRCCSSDSVDAISYGC